MAPGRAARTSVEGALAVRGLPATGNYCTVRNGTGRVLPHASCVAWRRRGGGRGATVRLPIRRGRIGHGQLDCANHLRAHAIGSLTPVEPTKASGRPAPGGRCLGRWCTVDRRAAFAAAFGSAAPALVRRWTHRRRRPASRRGLVRRAVARPIRAATASATLSRSALVRAAARRRGVGALSILRTRRCAGVLRPGRMLRLVEHWPIDREGSLRCAVLGGNRGPGLGPTIRGRSNSGRDRAHLSVRSIRSQRNRRSIDRDAARSRGFLGSGSWRRVAAASGGLRRLSSTGRGRRARSMILRRGRAVPVPGVARAARGGRA